MKLLFQVSVLLALTTGVAGAQMGYTLYSLDSLVAEADLVVRGSVSEVVFREQMDEQRSWLEVTLKIDETLKGSSATGSVSFARQVHTGDQRWEQFIESGQQQLWFLMDSERPVAGETADEVAIRARHLFKTGRTWSRIRLGREVDGEAVYSRPPPPIFTMNFELLTEREQILAATRASTAAEGKARLGHRAIRIPRILAQRTGSSGDANAFIVPADHRLEALAQRLIDSPEDVLGGIDDEGLDSKWLEFSANRLRAEGVKALQDFPSEANEARLRALLDHPATAGRSGSEQREYYVRKEAFRVLRAWLVPVERPVMIE